MSNHAILSVEHLGKVFKSGERSVNVLSDVSFVIDEGSTCAIVGPSGSGKTTLIAICASLPCCPPCMAREAASMA